MASSSSSSHPTPASSFRSCKYDVFVSFRGEDTRKTFVDHLHSTLKHHLISVYKDNETLPRGESIDQSLFEAIKESQIAVIIFSKNYVDSSWCLEELAYIMKCKVERGLIVIPIFYDVEPSECRNQKRRFEEAFAKHEAKNFTKAAIWRQALVDVSNIAGWELKNVANGHESQFIKIIVDTILDTLFVLNSCVDEDLVGMRARFQDLESLLDIDSSGVHMVGIWGLGGSGKTTLATSFYMKIYQHFQGQCCIVENVREETSKHGLNKLQENILSALFKKEMKVHSVAEGKRMMKSMLCRRKVLVLLDDVDTLDQLEALAGKHNWFGCGSRIIITTRDEHLLKTHKVNHIYPVTLLSEDEAIRLFRRHAYNEDEPVENYETLSLHVISYASGLPLSLKVLGSFLYDKNKDEWLSALKKLKDIPNPKVMNILKISYDGLESYEKELFLDIACFWRNQESFNPTEILEILEACDLHPRIGLKVLKQKALITISEYKNGVRFDMHDLVQEMGHYIVRGEYPKNPEKHSRIWIYEEIKEMCFWDTITENETIEGVKCRFDQTYRNNLLPLGKFVSNMKKLRWLSVSTKGQEGPSYLSNELRYIDWSCYPTSFFPDTFLPQKLVVLKLDVSMQKQLWKCNQDLPHLKVLHLSYMSKLLRTPDFNRLPHLQKLTLSNCIELEEIHPSLGNHTSLEYLNVSYCDNLKRLPRVSQMKNIKTLKIMDCRLKEGQIPSGIDDLSNLQELILAGNSFSRLDFSLVQLTQLKSLNLSRCQKLLELPELPPGLAILTAHDCKSLTIVDDFSNDCKELCQVSLIDGWGEILLQAMLKENATENGSMHLCIEGLEILKGFTPLRIGSDYRLKLPENWCNDFSGFLMCTVLSKYIFFGLRTSIGIQQMNGVEFEEDMVWEESDGDSDVYMTYVWYVPFGSLRHTTWWDQTYKALEFNILDTYKKPIAFGVRLVDKESTSGRVSDTSTNSSSPYTPKFKIIHDSAFELTAELVPYNLWCV